MSRKLGNGERSISYRSKEIRWEARYTVHTPKGPKRRSVYGKTRAEAHAKPGTPPLLSRSRRACTRALSKRCSATPRYRRPLTPTPTSCRICRPKPLED